jgi:hypothetical protein
MEMGAVCTFSSADADGLNNGIMFLGSLFTVREQKTEMKEVEITV